MIVVFVSLAPRKALGAIDASLGQPFITMLEWDAGAIAAYPTSAAWHCGNVVYVVIDGNVTVTVENETRTLVQNDVLWVRAGTPHSPFAPSGAGARMLSFVAPYAPRYDDAPETPSELAKSDDLSHRFYLEAWRSYSSNDVDHFEWCVALRAAAAAPRAPSPPPRRLLHWSRAR